MSHKFWQHQVPSSNEEIENLAKPAEFYGI